MGAEKRGRVKDKFMASHGASPSARSQSGKWLKDLALTHEKLNVSLTAKIKYPFYIAMNVFKRKKIFYKGALV